MGIEKREIGICGIDRALGKDRVDSDLVER